MNKPEVKALNPYKATSLLISLSNRLVEIKAFAQDIEHASTDPHSKVSAKHIIERLEGLNV